MFSWIGRGVLAAALFLATVYAVGARNERQAERQVASLTSKTSKKASRLGALLLDDGGGLVLCSAVAISRWHVLTAAHCVEGLTSDMPMPRVVLTDDHGKAPESGRIAIERFKMHPGYEGEPGDVDDIAVAVLSSPLPKNWTTLALPSKPKHPLLPFAGIVAGYGHGGRNGKKDLAGELRIYGVTAITDWGAVPSISAYRSKRPYPCFGDSGGALIEIEDRRPRLRGLMTTIYAPAETARCTHYFAASDLFAHTPWIREVMRGDLAPTREAMKRALRNQRRKSPPVPCGQLREGAISRRGPASEGAGIQGFEASACQ